ncbi:hypothetical protein [Halomonas sp. WWR20]
MTVLFPLLYMLGGVIAVLVGLSLHGLPLDLANAAILEVAYELAKHLMAIASGTLVSLVLLALFAAVMLPRG